MGRHLVMDLDPTAQAMITLINWDTQGALSHRFCLLQSFRLEGDKYVFNLGMRLMDGSGNGYYISRPPFSIMFAYILFKAFSIRLEVLNLQILNLIAHLITALFVYQILRIGLAAHPSKDAAALVGSIFFIFLAPNLWFFSTFYSWDTFWVYLWVIGLYQVVKLFQQISEGKASRLSLFGLGVVNFFLVYSEYQGVLYSLSVILVALTRIKSSEYYKRVIGRLVLTSVVAILISFTQYSSIDGLGSFIQAFLHRGYSRSLLAARPRDVLIIGKHYWEALGVVLVPLALMALIWLRLRSKQILIRFTRAELTLLFLAMFPVAVHHILFLEFTGLFRQAILQSTPVLAIIMAMLLSKTVFLRPEGTVGMKYLIIVLVIASLIGSVYTYRSYYAQYYAQSRDPEGFYLLGETIRSNAKDTEVVFAIGESPRVKIRPPVIYYSRRNIQEVRDLKDARVWLERHGRSEGIVFFVKTNFRIDHFERIRAREPA
jgi:hypothetical protein